MQSLVTHVNLRLIYRNRRIWLEFFDLIQIDGIQHRTTMNTIFIYCISYPTILLCFWLRVKITSFVFKRSSSNDHVHYHRTNKHLFCFLIGRYTYCHLADIYSKTNHNRSNESLHGRTIYIYIFLFLLISSMTKWPPRFFYHIFTD